MILEIILIGLILSIDSFSAALALGFKPHTNLDSLKFALASGSAEALVTFVAALAGANIIAKFESIDHWIAFGVLFLVAAHMLYESIMHLVNKNQQEEENLSFHSFFKIIIVSFATSLDALGVGVGLGIMDKPLWPYIVSIGLWAFMATLLGLYLARRISKKFAPICGIFGSLVLFFLSFQMLKI